MNDELAAPPIVDRSTFECGARRLARAGESPHQRRRRPCGRAHGGCRWSRCLHRRRSSASTARSHCWTRSRDAACSLPITSCGIPANPRRSSARAAPGSHHRCASSHISMRVMPPTPCSARARTKRAGDIATSWAGTCPGIQPWALSRLFWWDGEWAGCTSSATCGRGPRSSRPTGPPAAASNTWITAIACST